MNNMMITILDVLRFLHPFVSLIAMLAVALLSGYITQTILLRVIARARRGDSNAPHHVADMLSSVRPQVAIAVTVLVILDRFEILQLNEVWARDIQRLLLCVLDVLAATASISFLGVIMRELISRYRSESGNGPDPQVATRVTLIATITNIVIWLIALAFGLLIFPGARSLGATLLASAGLVGIVSGLAARPILENLIAGIQLALAQPLRLDDVIVVNGEYGTVEEITATYVVIRCWDRRRLVYPLTYFVTNNFENWTRRPTELIGQVILYVDYAMPLDQLREACLKMVEAHALWSGGVAALQVIDTDHPGAMKLRVLVSSSSPSLLWDLRCAIREEMIGYMQANFPSFLPQQRTMPLQAQSG
jgi:small-conductance mechanosensitive channel